MGVLLLGTPGGPRVGERLSLYALLSYGLLVVSAVLACGCSPRSSAAGDEAGSAGRR